MRVPRSGIATNSVIVAAALGALTTFCLIYLAGFLSENVFARVVVTSPIICGLLSGVALRDNEINGLKRAVGAGLISYIELYVLLLFSVLRYGLEWTHTVLGYALHITFYPPIALYGPVASIIGGFFGWLIASAIAYDDIN